MKRQMNLRKRHQGRHLLDPSPSVGLEKHYRAAIRQWELWSKETLWRIQICTSLEFRQFLSFHTKKLLQLPQVKLRVIVGLLTGHSWYKYHLCRMCLSADEISRICKLEKETEHIDPPNTKKFFANYEHFREVWIFYRGVCRSEIIPELTFNLLIMGKFGELVYRRNY